MWRTKVQGFPALFLLANSIAWFTLTMLAIGDITQGRPLFEILSIASAYFGGLIGSAALGATILHHHFKNRAFLLLWVLFGVIICSIFSLWITTDVISVSLKSVFLGLSVGLGIPTCFGFFGDLTKIEHRGKVAAVMFFAVQLFTVLVLLVTDSVNPEYLFLVLALWRLLGLPGAVFYKPVTRKTEILRTSLTSVIKERSFVLYFLPWFLFTLVNFIEAPIIEASFGPDLYNTSVMATGIISSISAFLAGALSDFKGRKIAGISGFVLLGLGYAFLSFFSSGPTKEIAQYLYIICDGSAWGILFVTFIFILWGDLSEEKIREKYYFMGSLPYLFSGVIQILIQPFVGNVETLTTSFSLASFFLFLAIVPLLFAAETLPEKAMKDRDLKSYLEKAQKIATKDDDKKKKKETKTKEEEEPKQEEKSEEYDEARKLAEKYY